MAPAGWPERVHDRRWVFTRVGLPAAAAVAVGAGIGVAASGGSGAEAADGAAATASARRAARPGRAGVLQRHARLRGRAVGDGIARDG